MLKGEEPRTQAKNLTKGTTIVLLLVLSSGPLQAVADPSLPGFRLEPEAFVALLTSLLYRLSI